MQTPIERCQDCGSPTTMKHLRNCKTYGAPSFRNNSNETATRAQLDFVSDLIKELGYNEEDYNLDEINSTECSKLIDMQINENKVKELISHVATKGVCPDKPDADKCENKDPLECVNCWTFYLKEKIW